MIPARFQPPLPVERILLAEPPDPEATPLDVLFVGAGPAGLAGAIELARLARQDAELGGRVGAIEIGVLEKAAGLGEHNLSGAVVDPRAFQQHVAAGHGDGHGVSAGLDTVGDDAVTGARQRFDAVDGDCPGTGA